MSSEKKRMILNLVSAVSNTFIVSYCFKIFVFRALFSELFFGIGALLQTIGGSPEGLRLRNPMSVIRAQGAFSGEFGGMLSTGAMGRQTDMASDLGITLQELTQLQRVFQTMTPDIRNSVDSFKESGITGRVAAKEMVKASDAIALAGDDFNEFIKDGIVNSKKTVDGLLSNYIMGCI